MSDENTAGEYQDPAEQKKVGVEVETHEVTETQDEQPASDAQPVEVNVSNPNDGASDVNVSVEDSSSES